MLLKVKPIRQKPDYCGVVSLKMVLDYYGIVKSEKYLAKLSGWKKNYGTSAEGIIKAAQQLGFEAFKKDFSTLEDIKQYLNQKNPVIVDWFSQDDGHYSVAVGINKKNIYLQDPEIGRIKKLDRKVFMRVWFDFPKDYLQSKNELIIRRIIVIEAPTTLRPRNLHKRFVRAEIRRSGKHLSIPQSNPPAGGENSAKADQTSEGLA